MRNYIKNVLQIVVLPAFLVWGLASFGSLLVSKPEAITPTSQESWLNPFSWGLDEAAAEAARMANEAQSAATAYALMAAIFGALGTAVAISTIIGLEKREQLKLPKKSKKSDAEIVEDSADDAEDEDEEPIVHPAQKAPRRGHPAGTK